MRFRLCLAATALALFCAAARTDDAKTDDAKLAALFKTYLEAEMKARPVQATRLGDHRYDALVDDISAKARAGWVGRWQNTLAEIRKLDDKKLSRASQIDRDIFAHDLVYSLWVSENQKPFETDPRTYNEYITEGVFYLLTQSTAPKADNLKNAASRIDAIPRVVASAKESLKVCPKIYVETAIRQNKGNINFYTTGVFEASGENPATSSLAAPAKRAIAALEAYQTFLEKDVLPKANDEWRLGKEAFARKLVLELNTGKTAAEVLKAAESAFDRVEREMYVVSRQLWHKVFPGKTLPPDDADGRRATVMQVVAETSKDHGKAEDLVKDAEASVAKIKAFIRDRDILRLPEPDRCKIIEMPEFQRGFSTAYLNPAPPLDPKSASHYAISPPPASWDARRVQSLLEEYNRNMLQILTIHEAYPGHYVQLEYSNRTKSLIRRVLSSGIFAEGWAVYTEQMMLDQGYGGGDLALRLNQLKFYLRAVGNAILDHKMHCDGMTDEQAKDFLMKRAYQSEGEAVGKIIRAKLSSCQLSTYFIGRMAFYELRQSVQRELGEAFELGRYHEAVLDHGTIPVKYLPELVRERLKKPR